MNKKNALPFVIIVFIIAGFIFSCASTQVGDEKHSAAVSQTYVPQNINSLAYRGIELELPEGWHFLAPGEGATQLDLFHFVDKTGTMKGKVMVETLNNPISVKKYAELHLKRLPFEYEIAESLVEHQGFVSKYYTRLIYTPVTDNIKAVFLKKNNVYATLWLVHGKDLQLELPAFLDRFRNTFDSFRYTNPTLEKRIQHDGIMFRNFRNEAWQWATDFEDGYLFRHSEENYLLLAGICSAERAENFIPSPSENTVKSPFKYAAFIKNEPRQLSGEFWTDNSGHVHGTATFTTGNRDWLLYMGLSPLKEGQDNADLFQSFLEKPTLQTC